MLGYLDLGVAEKLTMLGKTISNSRSLSTAPVESPGVKQVVSIGLLLRCLVIVNLCAGCSSPDYVSKNISDGLRQVAVFPLSIPVPWLQDGIPLGRMHYGYADKSGRIVIPPQYEEGGDFKEGLAAVKLNGKYGFIDRSGKLVIAYQFDDARWFSEGMAGVRLGDQWGFIDASGKLAIPPRFSSVWNFEEGVSKVSVGLPGKPHKTAFVDKKGKFAIQPKFDVAGNLSEGLMDVQIDAKWGYSNASGKLVIPTRYDEAQPFHGGLAGVRIGDKWGVIDRTGKMIIKPVFDEVDSFSEGLAKVVVADKKINDSMKAIRCGKWGFINRSGKYVILPQYDEAENFNGGRAKVYFRDAKGFIWYQDPGYVDHQGKYTSPKGDRTGANWGYEHDDCAALPSPSNATQ
ncbi:MAG: WG repeat-containing protein [Anaerolineae bacterium]|nr:WG repeat-containing protein [Gloeobacterales cyanobacterium ES-bin-313]